MANLLAPRWLLLAELAAICMALPSAAIAESPLTGPEGNRVEVNVGVVPSPFDPALPSSHYDGLFIGKNMLVYPTPDLSLVEAFAPPGELTNADRILISINGIGCDVPQAVIETEAKAVKEGCRAVCLYDDSAESVLDVLQAAGHKMNLGESKTVVTLKSVIV